MVTKGFQQLMAEAVAAAEQMAPADAVSQHGNDAVVFIDVREPGEVAQARVPGSVHVPRGLLEVVADPAMPPHNPVFASGKRLLLYCASGGRSALAAKTLTDMGIKNVANISGGIQGWMQAGGPLER